MCCVLIFEDKTGRIHLCKDVQLRNLGTVTAEMTGGAGVAARRLDPRSGQRPPVHDGTHLALIVIYLGAVGVGALLTLGSGGYGTKRLLARHRRRRAATVANAR